MSSSSHGQLLEDVVKRLATQDAGKWFPRDATRHDRFSLSRDRPRNACADDENVPDARGKVEAATQLRDNLDVFTNMASYSIFLKRVMPVFVNILNGPCIFQSNSNEQVCLLPYYSALNGNELILD